MTRPVTQMAPLAPGDDPAAWLRIEIPNWSPMVEEEGWSARSPSWEVDGLLVWAEDPMELVERVRTVERLIALAAGRHGSVQVSTVAGVDLDDPLQRAAVLPGGERALPTLPPPEPVRSPESGPAVPYAEPPRRRVHRSERKALAVSEAVRFDPTAVGPPTLDGQATVRDLALRKGYTGDPCMTCGSWSTRRAGSCVVCDDCGSNSGCG